MKLEFEKGLGQEVIFTCRDSQKDKIQFDTSQYITSFGKMQMIYVHDLRLESSEQSNNCLSNLRQSSGEAPYITPKKTEALPVMDKASAECHSAFSKFTAPNPDV